MGRTYGFQSKSIADHPQRDEIGRILNAALTAADPAQAIRKAVRRAGSLLQIGSQLYDLDAIGRIVLLAFGKAAPEMALALAPIIKDKLGPTLVIAKHAPDFELRFPLLIAGHPIPDERSLEAGRRALDMLADLTSADLLICLVSGGGSALLTCPIPGIELVDLQSLTVSLLHCGASITEINTLRRHLDQVKGGGLAVAAAPARTVSLILSDVVGDSFEAIASGPTAPDPTTRNDALNILERYRSDAQFPKSIMEILPDVEETPKEEAHVFNNVHNLLIGSNLLSIQAGLYQAQQEGFHANVLTASLQGEARQAGGFLGNILRQISATGQPLSRPACLIAGGETTVIIRGRGLGGRNQELALGAIKALSGLDQVMLISLASDGEDGPTDAAGAVVTGETLSRSEVLGLSVSEFLAQNDSYHFFQPLKDLIMTGPTGTNVNDLVFLFAF